LGVGAWIVLVVVIAGMVTLFVVIAIAVSQTGGPSAIVGSHQHTY
jgi:hypothetical protein